MIVKRDSCASNDGVMGYAGRDLSDVIEINGDRKTRSVSLVVTGITNSWCLYAGPTVESVDMTKLVRSGVADGVYHIDVARDHPNYFQFISHNDKAIIAERLLPLYGGYNFRDLGGYRTVEGRYVKWGKIFRSDDLSLLTKEDMAYLATIPIRTVVDFRSKDEINMASDKMLWSDTKYYALPIEPGNISDIRNFVNLTSDDVEAKMRQMNEYFVTKDDAIAQWRKYFGLLQQGRMEPIVFHCSAGKDRTGMAAALTLLALGVSEQTVMADYLLSNDCLVGKYQQYIDRYAQLRSLFMVKREFLQAGIDKIKQEYGSPEKFLTDKLSVNIEKLRGQYLY